MAHIHFSASFLIRRSHSISFTRALGIPRYKTGLGGRKDGIVGERLAEMGGGGSYLAWPLCWPLASSRCLGFSPLMSTRESRQQHRSSQTRRYTLLPPHRAPTCVLLLLPGNGPLSVQTTLSTDTCGVKEALGGLEIRTLAASFVFYLPGVSPPPSTPSDGDPVCAVCACCGRQRSACAVVGCNC